MPMQAWAQEAVPVTVSGQVTIHNKENGKDIHERVEYTMLTKAEALEAKAAFDKLTGEGDKSQSITGDEIEAIDRLKRREEEHHESQRPFHHQCRHLVLSALHHRTGVEGVGHH